MEYLTTALAVYPFEEPGTIPVREAGVGVECGQVVLAMIILPFIWRLRHRSTSFELYARPASIAIVILGAHWLVERTLLS